MPTGGYPESLPDKLYLLSCDLEQHRLRRSPELGVLLRGAMVAELNLRGLLTEDETTGGKVRASGSRRAGDQVLDGVLREVEESRPRSWSSWIRRGRRGAARAVRDGLAERGLIELDSDPVLGVFPRRRVRVTDPAQVRALRERVRELVLGATPVARVDRADAVLAALVAAGQVRHVLTRKELREHRQRMAELGERGGEVVPALNSAVRQARNARIAASSG